MVDIVVKLENFIKILNDMVDFLIFDIVGVIYLLIGLELRVVVDCKDG